jgi:hypothetical protein
MGFKINFLLWILVELLWFGLQLAFMAVIYRHTDRIASWTQWQVVSAGGRQPPRPAGVHRVVHEQLREAVGKRPQRHDSTSSCSCRSTPGS